MTRVYWDAMLFIYFLEDHPEHGERMQHILEQMSIRGHVLCTSILTLGEILVGVYKHGTEEQAAAVRSQICPPLVELLPFSVNEADRFARIRAAHPVSPADAIHLATAAEAGVQLFLTNDRTVSRQVIRGIDFIAGLDVNLY